MYSRVYRYLEIGCYKLVSEPWSVLSGPELVLLLVVFEWYVELPSILFVVVLTCCLVFGLEERWLVEAVGMMMRLQWL